MSDQVKRIRSPNYPAISLRAAINQLPGLHERIHKHSAPKEAIVKAFGYSGWNGSSALVVSAHTKFGLLDRVDGDQFKISDRAMRIMFPKDTEERKVAIREAALAPTLYGDLVKEFGDTPPHEDILRPWLIRRGFAVAATGAVIQGYRDTMALVITDGPGYESGDDAGSDTNMQTQSTISSAVPIVQAPAVGAPPGARQEKISDDDGQIITLIFPSEPSLETYEFVKEYLEFRIARLKKVAKQKFEESLG